MVTQNAVNLKVTNNADGFDVAGGTTARKLTLSGADVAIAGTGTAVYSMPGATDTLVGLAAIQTLTSKTLTSPAIITSPTAAGATWVDLGSVTTCDINGGTADAVTIGGATPAAGTFTSITTNGDITATAAAIDVDMIDNNASAISFDASGRAGILELVTSDNVEGIKTSARILGAQGADVTAANDMTLVVGNYFDITGATECQRILGTGWTAGSVITLQFDAAPLVKHNTAAGGGLYGFQLAGAGDFQASAGDTLMLVFDGAWWREISRTVI